MTTAEWITASLVFIIAAILAVVSIRSLQNKGFLFNNAYIYASKEEIPLIVGVIIYAIVSTVQINKQTKR